MVHNHYIDYCYAIIVQGKKARKTRYGTAILHLTSFVRDYSIFFSHKGTEARRTQIEMRSLMANRLLYCFIDFEYNKNYKKIDAAC